LGSGARLMRRLPTSSKVPYFVCIASYITWWHKNSVHEEGLVIFFHSTIKLCCAIQISIA
jgi:predicted phosphoadenosine phosphosulfate sulfurtransferase